MAHPVLGCTAEIIRQSRTSACSRCLGATLQTTGAELATLGLVMEYGIV